MTRETIALGTVGVLLASNLFGLIYSMVVLKTTTFKKFRIQTKAYKEGVFGSRMPLFIFNFIILLIFSGFGTYFMYDLFETQNSPWWLIVIQVILAFVIDDIWFYIFHRWLHENKFMLKHVHSIHHRATTPFPLEYLYAHPAEWMLGMLGVVLGFGLMLLFMPVSIYSLWIFGGLRNLHEIHIHSDLQLPILSKLPLISKTKHHDDHHAKLTGNYSSTFVWMDKIFKTDFKN
jgi:sterol desaturase/sphingolipid hydroxylase (fatty acid hydroxylase superfamily)